MTDLLRNPALLLAAVAVVGLFIFALARGRKQSAARGRGRDGDGGYPHAADAGSSNDCGGDGGGD